MARTKKPRPAEAPKPSAPSDPPVPRWLAAGLWLVVAGSLGMSARHALGSAPPPAPAKEIAPPTSGAEPLPGADLLATDEDRALLAYFCGPSALARALESVALAQGVAAFDRERTFGHVAKLCDPQVGRGTTLLDLKRAAERMAPVRAEGVRFESGDKLLAMLGGAKGAAAVVHLDPVAERQAGPVATGHFAAVAPEPSDDPARARQWIWFDPLDGVAAEERAMSRGALAKLLDERSSGNALVVGP